MVAEIAIPVRSTASDARVEQERTLVVGVLRDHGITPPELGFGISLLIWMVIGYGTGNRDFAELPDDLADQFRINRVTAEKVIGEIRAAMQRSWLLHGPVEGYR
jgi:hypothetical protein